MSFKGKCLLANKTGRRSRSRVLCGWKKWNSRSKDKTYPSPRTLLLALCAEIKETVSLSMAKDFLVTV